MPKIFLIKDRLHQQQLKLQEQQNGGKNALDIVATADSPGGSPQQPLPLIVERKDEGKDMINTTVIPTVDWKRNQLRMY